MHPCSWLDTNGLTEIRLLLFLLRQYTLRSACPVAMLTNRTSIVSPRHPPPSLLLSYQHPLVWSGTQHAATPLWNLKLAACKEPFTGKSKRCCNQRSLHSPASQSKLSSRWEDVKSPFPVAGWRSCLCRYYMWFCSRLEVFSLTLAT